MPIFITLFFLAAYAVYFYWNKQKENRKNLQSFFVNRLIRIGAAVKEFEYLINHKAGYFSNYQLTKWLAKYHELNISITGKSIKEAKLDASQELIIFKFLDYYPNANTYRSKYNTSFLNNELIYYKDFFDTVTGKPLDLQQRTAIIQDEDANLVIAGAGSGKTTTIVGKVKYVIDRYNTDPGDILLISFTKKSAHDLATRVDVKDVIAKTFHSYGIEVITQVEGKRPSIFDEKQFKPFITKTYQELIKQDDYLELITDYFENFLKPVVSRFDFKSHGEYIQYLKDQNFKTYKEKAFTYEGRNTYKMEVVKSIEECKIANFLLFNGIEYEYELPYEHETATLDKRQYRPDFSIFQNGKRIYLEHQAISKENKVPPFFAKENETLEQASNKYLEKIKWHKKLHNDHGTQLIETFSHEMHDGSLLPYKLTKKLEKAGIELNPMSEKEKWDIIQKSANDEVESFITLFQTFIALMKSNDYTISELIEKNTQEKDVVTRERNRRYIALVQPVFERYQKHLAERQEIDFSDMINKASAYISEGKYNKKFDYLIIDEFQDISIGRYNLIKALKNNNPAGRLFCVGDDWQSIYRFTGSDMALFKDFEQYFGYSIKSKIETTYRFANPIIKLSSEFILKNPNQTSKELQQKFKDKSTDYKIVYSEPGSQNEAKALKGIFDELIKKVPTIKEKSIMVLGRYTADLDRLGEKENTFRVLRKAQVKEDKDGKLITLNRFADTIEYAPYDKPSLKAEFLTVHKSKGLEADIVVVINCNSGKFGFPAEMSDDKALNLLLSKADQFENGEERRLFYVAMTRAREMVYFIADKVNKSKFITELEASTPDKALQKCPYCKTADVVVKKKGTAKNGSNYTFWGCTNFQYGCEYGKTVWESKTAPEIVS